METMQALHYIYERTMRKKGFQNLATNKYKNDSENIAYTFVEGNFFKAHPVEE